jgi:hypothetical protein
MIGFLARLIEAPQHHGIDHGIKRLDSFDARFDRVWRRASPSLAKGLNAALMRRREPLSR